MGKWKWSRRGAIAYKHVINKDIILRFVLQLMSPSIINNVLCSLVPTAKPIVNNVLVPNLPCLFFTKNSREMR